VHIPGSVCEPTTLTCFFTSGQFLDWFVWFADQLFPLFQIAVNVNVLVQLTLYPLEGVMQVTSAGLFRTTHPTSLPALWEIFFFLSRPPALFVEHWQIW